MVLTTVTCKPHSAQALPALSSMAALGDASGNCLPRLVAVQPIHTLYSGRSLLQIISGRCPLAGLLATGRLCVPAVVMLFWRPSNLSLGGGRKGSGEWHASPRS